MRQLMEKRSFCMHAGCSKKTSDGKPYCLDHVGLLPHPMRVLDEIGRRDAEIELASTEEGWKSVDPGGLVAEELIRCLERNGGSASFKRLALEGQINAAAAEGYVKALVQAGLVRELGRTRKGNRLVVLCSQREGGSFPST
jgi:hypothetical protein